jgi:hypothetical protein
MDQRETQLIAEGVIGPHFSNGNLKIVAEPPRAVDAAGRHVEMERRPKTRERCPLRHRLEVIDRLGRLDLDDAQQFPPALVRLQNQIRIPEGRSGTDPRRLFGSRIDGDVELSLILRLQQSDDPIVLELLADGPHEDGAQ